MSIAATPAQATILTYRFAMNVDHMFEHDGVSGTNTTVQSSSLPGVPFAIGYQVIGTLSFDTEAPLSAYQPPTPSTGTYQLYSGGVLTDLRFVENSWHFSSDRDASMSLIQLGNDASSSYGWDVFYAGASSAYSPITFEQITFNFFDATGTALQSSYLAGMSQNFLSLSAFSYANLDYGWLRVSDGSQMHASGRVTSLEAINTVPISSTWTLLLAAILALSIARRRQNPFL